jgi:hypothetical protein
MKSQQSRGVKQCYKPCVSHAACGLILFMPGSPDAWLYFIQRLLLGLLIDGRGSLFVIHVHCASVQQSVQFMNGSFVSPTR